MDEKEIAMLVVDMCSGAEVSDVEAEAAHGMVTGTPQEVMDFFLLKTIEGFRILKIQQIRANTYKFVLIRLNDWAKFDEEKK